MSVILDGTGAGYRAKVDDRNRVKINGTVREELLEASYDGRAFNINSEAITFTTTGTDLPLLYVKNNDTRDLVLTNFFISQSDRATASASDVFRLYASPSAGSSNDIIANGTDVTVVNRKVGTPNAFNIVAKKGGEGFDVTFAEPPMFYGFNTGFSNVLVNYVIPTGQSIVVVADRISTTGDVYVGFNGYISAGE